MGKFLWSCLKLATGPQGELADLILPRSQLQEPARSTDACLPALVLDAACSSAAMLNAKMVAGLKHVPWLRGHQDHISACRVPAVPLS